jgi:propanol-preferring alcohol dehydrogenase
VRAAVYSGVPNADGTHLRIEDVPHPQLQPGHVLLRVIACGVCRTDLHIVERDLPSLRSKLIPGHQIVGEVVEGSTDAMPLGTHFQISK